MSLETDKNRSDYIGNGAVNQYSYVFKIFNEEHVTVVVRDLLDVETELELATDYTVEGVGDEGGGYILLTDSSQNWIDTNGFLVDEYVLTIRRVVPLTQETDFRNQGSFLPESHEDTFDLSRMIDQQLNEEIGRAVKLPETIPSTDFDPTLPGDIQDPERVFLTNDTGDGFRMGPTASDIENAQAYAISAGHSMTTAKDWAIKTDGTIVDSETGIDSLEYSAKEYAQGVYRRGAAGGGSAKDWANHTAGTVNDTEYSAKYYADQAANSAIAAAITVAASNWNDVVYIIAAQSPYAITESQAGSLFSIDATDGPVVMTLPEIATLDLSVNFSLSVLKTDDSDNTVTINSSASDTIADDTSQSDLIEIQNGGRTFIPDLDLSPDQWSKLSYGEGGSTEDSILTQDRNIKLMADGELEHYANSTTTLTSVYSQQTGGGAPVTNPVDDEWGAAYFVNAVALTDIRRAKVKLLSTSGDTGDLTVILVEADGSGKPLFANVVATFNPVDVTTFNFSLNGNGTEVNLDSPDLFNLDANQNYAFIYDMSTISSTGTAQVVVIGTPSLTVIGGGYVNAGDETNLADWIATTSPADAEDMALTLYQETTTAAVNELKILDKMYLNIPGFNNTANEIAAGDYVMAEGNNLVVTLNRDSAVDTVLAVTTLPYTATLDIDDFVIARMFNGDIFVGFNSELRLSPGESGYLDYNGDTFEGSFLNQTTHQGSIEGFLGSVVGTGVTVKNFANIATKNYSGALSSFDTTTGLYTVLEAGNFSITGTGNSISGTAGPIILIDGVYRSVENGSTTTFDSSSTFTSYLSVGQTIGFTIPGGGMNDYQFSISYSIIKSEIIASFDDPLVADFTLPINVFSATCSSTAVLTESSPFISSVVNNSTGNYTVNFTPGIFSTAPIVLATPARGSGNSDVDITVDEITSSSCTIITTLAHITISPFESNFNISVQKAAADHSSTVTSVQGRQLAYSYSEAEQLTGETWIDGKPIYRRVINFPVAVTAATVIATWSAGLTILDSHKLQNTQSDEWLLHIYNGSGTSNRGILTYNDVTGEVATSSVDGTGQFGAGSNFIVRYIK